MQTLIYELDGNLYLNLTNRCTNACEFCVRQHDTYRSVPLWLDHEPSYEDFLPLLSGDLTRYREAVFCGYGEPLMRPDLVAALGKLLRSRGLRTRINTNGQANLFHGRNIVPELVGAIDCVNVSLNAPDPQKYDAVCHSEYGEKAFGALLDFAKACKAAGLETVFSLVDTIPAEDIEACRRLSEQMGIPLRVRAYIDEA